MNYIKNLLFKPAMNFVDLVVLLLVFRTLSTGTALIVWLVWGMFISHRLQAYFLTEDAT